MHGIAHVGVLKAFIEKGVKFDFIAGTSVGAIVGVLAAAKLPYREIEALTRRIEWPGIDEPRLVGQGAHAKREIAVDDRHRTWRTPPRTITHSLRRNSDRLDHWRARGDTQGVGGPGSRSLVQHPGVFLACEN